jgi:hypothetical protein
MPKSFEFLDARSNFHRVARHPNGGWTIWSWSRRLGAWVQDPLGRGAFSTWRDVARHAAAMTASLELAREYERRIAEAEL